MQSRQENTDTIKTKKQKPSCKLQYEDKTKEPTLSDNESITEARKAILITILCSSLEQICTLSREKNHLRLSVVSLVVRINRLVRNFLNHLRDFG
jgi:hypothetical protein